MTALTQAPRQWQAKRSRGFTLIETLVGLSLGLIVLGAVTYSLSSASMAQRSSGLATLAQEGQAALSIIAQHLQQAGYSRPRSNTDQSSASRNYTGLAVRGCDNGRFSNGTGEATEAVLDRLTCPTKPTPGGGSGKAFLTRSSIAIAYEADASGTVPTRTDPSLPTDCLGHSISQVSTAIRGGSYALANNRFFITADANIAGLFNLSCAANGGAAISWTAATLIGGLEDMVISYGLMPVQTNALGQVQYEGRIERYVSASELDDPSNSFGATTMERWSRVGAVRLCLLMMSAEANTSPSAAPYLDCSGALMTPTDRRLRLAVHSTIALRNKL
jgi:type IV pilus assembly protein PilW